MLKEALVTIALALGQVPSAIDGDTVKLAGVSTRLTDYDSPELFSAKCPKEHALALQARRELQALLTLAEAGSLKMSSSLRRARMPIMDDSAPKLRSMGSRLLHPHDCAETCHTLHLPTGLMPPEGRLV